MHVYHAHTYCVSPNIIMTIPIHVPYSWKNVHFQTCMQHSSAYRILHIDISLRLQQYFHYLLVVMRSCNNKGRGSTLYKDSREKHKPL